MNQTFVCCTTYHLYISILEAFKHKKQGDQSLLVFILDKIKDADEIIPILEKIDAFEIIVPIKAYAITDKMKKKMGLFHFLFRRSKALVKLFEEGNHGLVEHFEFLNNSEFNLFNTNRSRAYFVIKYPKAYMRMHEDGLAAYMKQISSLRIFLRKYILRFPILKGYDDQVKEFWVQQPNKMKDKILKPKLKKLDLQQLEDGISKVQKTLIINSFLGESPFLISDNRALIITQPFSEIGMMTEQEKINIYKDFIANAKSEGLSVFLKAHPGELTNYSEVFGNDVVILPKIFPLEILNLSSDFNFKKAYTVHSSALGNLKYVDDKIFSNKFGETIYNE